MSIPEPTIQIVDDDELFLAAISRLLRASGFAVKTFSSASDLLAAGDADAPGCVLADLQMPGMNGLDLQAALARTRNPLPILFLTGHGDIPSTVRAMRAGAVDFLEKRAPKEHLLDAVKRALARDARDRVARAHLRELRTRFDTLELGQRSAALAVDAVLGVRDVDVAELAELPALLRDTQNELVAALGKLDHELLVVLERSRLLPEAVWAALETAVEVKPT